MQDHHSSQVVRVPALVSGVRTRERGCIRVQGELPQRIHDRDCGDEDGEVFDGEVVVDDDEKVQAVVDDDEVEAVDGVEGV